MSFVQSHGQYLGKIRFSLHLSECVVWVLTSRVGGVVPDARRFSFSSVAGIGVARGPTFGHTEASRDPWHATEIGTPSNCKGL